MRKIEHFAGEYFFLSNFYPSEVRFEEAVYPTIEHAFQAAKTLSPEERLPFQQADVPPGKTKRMGRQLTLRPDWEAVKEEVMLSLLRYKFSDAHSELCELLKGTGDTELIEGNLWHDQIWGDCYCNLGEDGCLSGTAKPSCIESGQNKLGKLLMKVRDEIRCQC